MNYEKISSNLISAGIIFTSCGILREVKNNKDKISTCLVTNTYLGTVFLISGSILNIYNSLY